MPRPRTVSDADIFDAVRAILADDGDGDLSFSRVAAATGLSPATLVQRYGSRTGMLRAAGLAAWDAIDAATAQAAAAASPGPAGAVALLAGMSGPSAPADLRLLAQDFADPALRARAEAWRDTLLRALSDRVGSAAAQRMFLIWQGALVWSEPMGEVAALLEASSRQG